MNAQVSCPIFRCPTTAVAQCTGYRGTCDRYLSLLMHNFLSTVLMGLASLTSIRVWLVKGGGRAGDTTVSARDGRGIEKARLDVSVRDRKTVKVAFNFVRYKDASGNIVNHTSKSPSIADQWIEGMNNIFTPQTNVAFEKLAGRLVMFEGALVDSHLRRPS